jgi:hypothetical protein
MTLYDLDNLYKTTVSKLSKDERLWYCTRHLHKFQQMLNDTESPPGAGLRKNMEEMVKAIQEEIASISNSK